MDLFEGALSAKQGIPKILPNAPLAVRMRPQTIKEIVGQNHLLEPNSPLRNLLEAKGPSSVILWGPPGTGKTTLAYLAAQAEGRRFVELSAVNSGVKEIREVLTQAKRELGLGAAQTVLFIDEVHRFSKSQQDSLLPAVENRWVILIAATTENPSFSVISPLLSRSLLLTLKPLDHDSIRKLLQRALEDERGLNNLFNCEEEALEAIVRLCASDGRKSLTLLEAGANSAQSREDKNILASDIAKAADSALVRYSKDEHYDVASAFIKSMRGSDVDAALHYLARMLEAGEDPRFIARRIIICASEDVGMADPSILGITISAAQGVGLIGMPEARILLGQAVIAVALAPKSNRSYLAINKAIADVKAGKSGSVPLHLRDAHYQGAKSLNHGTGYRYAHDEPSGISAQQYLPDCLKYAQYYEPSNHGREQQLSQVLANVRNALKIR